MRLLKNIIIALLVLPLAVTAQNKKNVTKTLVGAINAYDNSAYQNLLVKQGEFKINFAETTTYKTSYYVIVRDANDKVLCVKMDNNGIRFKKENTIKILRAGYAVSDYVYTEKSLNSYYLHIGKKSFGPYDEIKDMFPDCFIYKNGSVYSYNKYSHDDPNLTTCSYTDESVYSNSTVRCRFGDTILEFKPAENVRYYTTLGGHYYLLYNDKYMTNTFMVVDSVGYELDGIVDKMDFKFSQNGSHWIAAYTNNLMVDGVTVLRLSENIKHIAIKNDGQYAYVIEGEMMSDRAYIGDKMLVKGVNVRWLAIDKDDRFNYICKSVKGYFYGIDNEMIDKNKDMNDYYYPDVFDNKETFVVKSDDGKHYFEFNYEDPYITIDNMRYDFRAIPHYAQWNEDEGCFQWNTVEDMSLYLYKFKVRK